MKIFTMPRGSGKTTVLINRLIADYEKEKGGGFQVYLAAHNYTAASIIRDRLRKKMEESGSMDQALLQRVIPIECVNDYPRAGILHIDELELCLGTLLKYRLKIGYVTSDVDG